MMEGGTINLDVPAVDGIRSRAQSGGSDFGAYKKSGGRIGTSGDWNRQRYEVSSIDRSWMVGYPLPKGKVRLVTLMTDSAFLGNQEKGKRDKIP